MSHASLPHPLGLWGGELSRKTFLVVLCPMGTSSLLVSQNQGSRIEPRLQASPKFRDPEKVTAWAHSSLPSLLLPGCIVWSPGLRPWQSWSPSFWLRLSFCCMTLI